MRPYFLTRHRLASVTSVTLLVILLSILLVHSAAQAAVRTRTLKDAALIDAPPRAAAGASFSCRLGEEGTVRCWGANETGQLGDGTTVPRSTPAPVAGIFNAIAVTAGARHACALLADGRVLCWGNNSFGQMGDSTNFVRTAPVPVINIGNAVGLAAGSNHSCALTSTGAVQCWGANTAGALGDGTTANRFAPVAVINMTGPAVALTAGASHTCALLGDGTARCWGRNNRGQLGDGTTFDRVTATGVAGFIDGIAIVAGSAHTCALVAGGNVKCWGANGSGQLGNGTRLDQKSPALVGGLLRSPVAIAAGGAFSCALLGEGSALCWGDNQSGQIGDGTATMRLTPVFVNGVSRAAAIAAGDRHACILLADGSAACWGLGGSGQLGNGATSTSFVPVTVAGGGGTFTAGAIAAGRRHVCALRANGTVSCWGDNSRGQLGDGTTTTRLVPTPVVGLPLHAVAVAAGEAHTCVLLIDGSASCWGDNDHGQLGGGVGGGGDFRTLRYWKPVVRDMGQRRIADR
jgi:alpha-tubulin suppressor-like RCC1 family protein